MRRTTQEITVHPFEKKFKQIWKYLQFDNNLTAKK